MLPLIAANTYLRAAGSTEGKDSMVSLQHSSPAFIATQPSLTSVSLSLSTYCMNFSFSDIF